MFFMIKNILAVLGKKMKVWERRLMKNFKVAPITAEETNDLFAPPPPNETSLARYNLKIGNYIIANYLLQISKSGKTCGS